MLYCQLPSMGDNLGAAGALGRRPAVSHLLQLRPEGLRATRQQFVSMWSWTRPCTHMTHRAYALLSTALEGRQSGRSRRPRASSCCEPSVAAAALRHADYRSCPASRPALHFIGLHAQDRTSGDVHILLSREGVFLRHGRTRPGGHGRPRSAVP